MVYKHKIVNGLAELIAKYGGGGKDPMMRAVWWGIKGQVPALLETLDNSEEAIKEIEDKLKEVLDIKPKPIPQVIEEVQKVVKKAPRKRAKKVEPAAEVEVIIEPAAEE